MARRPTISNPASDAPAQPWRLRLPLSDAQLSAFAERWRITRMALFGDVLAPRFDRGAAIDVLVQFLPNADWTLLDLAAMEAELSTQAAREVRITEDTGAVAQRHAIPDAREIYASRS